MVSYSGINNVSVKGGTGSYYRPTDKLTMSGIFQAHVDTEELNKVQAAFGFALESLQKGDTNVARLDIVGDNAVKYAKQLLESQLKNPNRHQLKDSISYSVTKTSGGGQRLEIFATAVNQQGVPYGTFVEYGSHPGGGPTYVQPKPFIRPALEFARANTLNNIQETLRTIFEEIAHGDYNYANMHFSNLTKEKTATRLLGNRALATNSATRRTSDNKSYGRPTHTALNKLGNELKSHYSYQSLRSQPTYNGISSQIHHDSHR